MEAARELLVEAVSVMHWEGIAFEFSEPEVMFERAMNPADREKRRLRLTTKQKRLIEAERYTHTLP